jgi:hypothetical protein
MRTGPDTVRSSPFPHDFVNAQEYPTLISNSFSPPLLPHRFSIIKKKAEQPKEFDPSAARPSSPKRPAAFRSLLKEKLALSGFPVLLISLYYEIFDLSSHKSTWSRLGCGQHKNIKIINDLRSKSSLWRFIISSLSHKQLISLKYQTLHF